MTIRSEDWRFLMKKEISEFSCENEEGNGLLEKWTMIKKIIKEKTKKYEKDKRDIERWGMKKLRNKIKRMCMSIPEEKNKREKWMKTYYSYNAELRVMQESIETREQMNASQKIQITFGTRSAESLKEMKIKRSNPPISEIVTKKGEVTREEVVIKNEIRSFYKELFKKEKVCEEATKKIIKMTKENIKKN